MTKVSLFTIIFYLIFKTATFSSTNIELSSLSVDQGFSITGEVSGDYFGYAVAGAGDINGDGISDFIVSAVRAATTGTTTPGAVYIIFGNKNSFSNISLSSGFSATQAVKITGTANADYFGWSVATAGDFNKDGVNDLAIGAPYAGYTISGGSTLNSAGAGYVIFGRTTWASTMNISAISPPSNGFEVQGSQTNGLVGYSLGKAGDVNGDGITDFLIGAPGESYGGTNSGTVYVVYGLSTGITNIDLYATPTLTSSKAFKIQGYNNLYLGRQVSYIGDFNGDGIDDILMGGHVEDSSSPGNAYVVFGKIGGVSDVDLASGLASTVGITIKGVSVGDALGFSVSAAGDFNGDGLADIILGAPFADPEGRNNAGAAFVIFGSTVSSSVIDLSQGLDSSIGIKIIGAAQDDSLGYTVSTGDINGDGIDDVMMGAFASTIPTKEGAVYVVYGRKTGIADVDLATNNLAEGFKITNAGDHDIGFSIGYAGDVNGDGNDDIIIGSMKTSTLGSAFVVYGTSSPSISQGDALDTIAKVQDAAIQVAQVVALGLTLLNYSNAGPMFFVALAKLLHYMKYLTIKYPEKLQYILDRPNSKLISIPSISSAPETVKDAVTKYSLPENFEKYDIPSSFLVNQWSFIMTILIIIAAIFVVELGALVTSKCEFLHSKINKLKESVKWNYILSVFIGNFGGIAFNTVLEMRRADPNSDVDSLSFSVCLIMNIAVVLVCIRILWILIRFFQEKRRLVQTRISRKFERFKAGFKGYKVVFDGFQNHSFLQVIYLLLFSLRLYFFNVIVAYLFESPLAQTILINIQGLLFIFYLGFKKPIKEKIEFIGSLLQELILQAIHICVLTLAVMDTMDIDEDSDLSVLFGNVIIGCNVLFVIVGLFYIFICVVRDICKISKSGDTLAEKDVTVRARNRNSSESQITLNIDQNLSTNQRSVDNSLVYNSNAEIEPTTKQNDSFHESTRHIPQGHVEYLTRNKQMMKEKQKKSPLREQGALHLQSDRIKRSGRDWMDNRVLQSPDKENSQVDASLEYNNNVNIKRSFWEKRKSNKNKKRIEN